MELIIGGAFQGKSDYAKKQHPEICWREGRDLGADEDFSASGVLNLHEFIRKEDAGRTRSGRIWRGIDKKKSKSDPYFL